MLLSLILSSSLLIPSVYMSKPKHQIYVLETVAYGDVVTLWPSWTRWQVEIDLIDWIEDKPVKRACWACQVIQVSSLESHGEWVEPKLSTVRSKQFSRKTVGTIDQTVGTTTSNFHKYAARSPNSITFTVDSSDSSDSSILFLNGSLRSLAHNEREHRPEKKKTENSGRKKNKPLLKKNYINRTKATKTTNNAICQPAGAWGSERSWRPCASAFSREIQWKPFSEKKRWRFWIHLKWWRPVKFCSEQSFTQQSHMEASGSVITFRECNGFKRKWCQTPQRCHRPDSQGGKQSKRNAVARDKSPNGTSNRTYVTHGTSTKSNVKQVNFQSSQGTDLSNPSHGSDFTS